MCIPNNYEELIKELESTADSERKKVLLQLLNTCATCPEARQVKKTASGEPDCSCRRAFATECRNQVYSFQQGV